MWKLSGPHCITFQCSGAQDANPISDLHKSLLKLLRTFITWPTGTVSLFLKCILTMQAGSSILKAAWLDNAIQNQPVAKYMPISTIFR